jgi:asparagine synthase (glutamine-hydrolysing)
MCGILGTIQFARPVAPELFQRQCDSLVHRGPDDSGVWLRADGHVALASRRLAIQDLSPAGHMPMSDPTGRVWVVFNGEIYNFKRLRRRLEQKGYAFRGGSDTEVLLSLYLEYGAECLPQLNGMFAFAVYDGRHHGRESLFLARDRAGEKPLYYAIRPDGISFASELKALMLDPELPRRLDLHAFNAFLTSGYVPGEMCILQGVKKLPPGHALRYDLNTRDAAVVRYWSLPHHDRQDTDADPDELCHELEDLLYAAVKDRLVADVPVGVLLSGGVDSSLVTAMAARASSGPVKTFTVTFPGHAAYDESRYARMVADHFGTDHYELAAESASVELLPEMARSYDEPLGDSSLIPTYLLSRLTKRYVTVVLGGDGGDELFGGYPHYRQALSFHRRRRLLPVRLRRLVQTVAGRLPVGIKGRNYALSLVQNVRSYATEGSFFDTYARRRLLSATLWKECETPHTVISAPPPEQSESSIIDSLTRIDFESYLPDDILVKVDRASMSVSLEVRAPLLDQHLIEFAFGRVPAGLKVNGNASKILLRRLAERVLPSALDLTRKQGFSLPLESWFKDAWGDFVRDILMGADTTIFSRKAIQSLLAGQQRGYSNTSRLFALTMFELWRREYHISV